MVDTLFGKKKIIFFIICASVLVVLLLFLKFWFSHSENIRWSFDEQMIENENNDFFDADLIRIDDKLYFNRYGNCFTYGTYELTENKAKRIFWKGISFSPTFITLNDVYQGKILDFAHSSDYIQYYNLESNKYENLLKINIPDKGSYQYFSSNDVLYVCSVKGNCYRLNGSKFVLVASEKLCGKDYDLVAVRNSLFYYFTYNGEKYKKLIKYDTEKKKIISEIDVSFLGDYYKSELYDFDLLSENAFLTVCRKNRYFIYKISFKEESIEEIYRCKENVILNGYSDKLFLAIESGKNQGIYSYSVETKELKFLKGNIKPINIYIFGSKWIYFVNNSHVLYRITQDGKICEKILE